MTSKADPCQSLVDQDVVARGLGAGPPETRPAGTNTTDFPPADRRWLSLVGHGDRNQLDSQTVGLVAGWGRYPVVIAEALRRQGQRVVCAGVEGHADPKLEQICHHFRWCGLSRIGTGICFFQKHGVRQATLAGKIFKVRLFQRQRLFRLFPDWTTLWMVLRMLRRPLKDDPILHEVCQTFANAGITILPATRFAPELLVNFGQLSRRGPSSRQQQDIEFGWQLAKRMGELDIGQSVVVKDGAPLAVEAIEGTDACIRRAGDLCPRGGLVVVKVAKPNQDLRFDMPTIGLQTLQTMVQAGGKVLAVEAGMTIFLDQAEVVDYANRHGLILVALHQQDGHIQLPTPETVAEP